VIAVTLDGLKRTSGLFAFPTAVANPADPFISPSGGSALGELADLSDPAAGPPRSVCRQDISVQAVC
jgi:hypothetical protein